MSLHIVESVLGTYAMHLSETGTNGGVTLCGVRNVMHTCFRLETWNSGPDHIPMGYCAECSDVAKRRAAELDATVPEATPATRVFHTKPK